MQMHNEECAILTAPRSIPALASVVHSPFRIKHSRSLFDRHQMTHLVNHTSRISRVFEFHCVANPPQAKPGDDGKLMTIESNRTPQERDLHRAVALRISSLVPHVYAPDCPVAK
jgi:hypothetical protein